MSRDNHSRLKTAQRQLNEARNLKCRYEQELESLEQKLSEQNQLVNHLLATIARIKSEGGVVVVTEHAILRYLERVRLIDLEGVKAEILPPEVEQQILTCGDGQYPVHNSWTLCVSGGVVTTVITKTPEGA